jgi:hypothetical protein
MKRACLCLLFVLAACGKKSNDPPPAKPSTGAPVAFVVDKVTPGDDMKGSLDVRAYNFSAKRVAQYGVLIRYSDASGKVVKIKVGTPFEKSFDRLGFSGKDYLCEPTSWCSFAIQHLDVPAKAVKAEVLAATVRALKDDIHFEDAELFDLNADGWPGAEKDAPPTAEWPAAFAPWDRTAREAAWQGAWAGDGNAAGAKAAWQVEGDKIDFFDSKGEQHMTLALESPCSAAFKTANGGFISTFTLENGQLVTGLGDAGTRKGDKAIVCGGGDVYTVEGATCTRWSNHFDRWESEPGTCGFKQDGGKDVFWYQHKNDNYEYKLQIAGDVIWSEQLAGRHAQKLPDLAAAKAAQGL